MRLLTCAASNPKQALQHEELVPGLTWKVVDYSDKESLTKALQGFHTVLSFVQILADQGAMSQKNLIDAAIAAGVKRFAPSEHGR
jgi:uncharacterized protein YbjT (DUF2867 family)